MQLLSCKTLQVFDKPTGDESNNSKSSQENSEESRKSESDSVSINAGTFTVKVPKGMDEKNAHIKGVQFFEFEKETSNEKKVGLFSFMSKGSKAFATGTHEFDSGSSLLKSSFCNVYQAKTSKNRYSSCEIFESNVRISDVEDKLLIEITPSNLQKVQGRNPMFIPIDFIGVDVNKFFAALTNQTVYYAEEVTSDYSADSLKGDFDRNFKKMQFKKGAGVSDELGAYNNIYTVELNDNVKVILAVGFYPYKNGSIAKILVKPTRDAEKGVRSVDWVDIKNKITALIASAVS